MENLPNETWLHIFASDVDPSTLAKLCRVSKRCHQIAQPLLYQRLALRFGAKNRTLVIRTLCERPDLAKLVRFADVEDSADPRDDILAAIQSAPALPDSLKNSLPGPSEDDDDGAFNRVALPPSMEAHAWAAVALALLPDLEELDMSVPFEKELIKTVFRLIPPAPPTGAGEGRAPAEEGDNGMLSVGHFSKLRKISLRHYDTEYATCMWEIPEVFGHPTVEVFHGFATDWCDESMPEDSTFSSMRLVNMRDVVLKYSLIDQRGLGILLTVCPNLRSLEIRWGSATVGDCELDLVALGDVLRSHGSGLEKLKLDPSESFAYEYERPSEGLGSLKNLRKLKDLWILHDVLVGEIESDEEDEEEDDDDDNSTGAGGGASQGLQLAQLLPKSLEVLSLNRCHGSSRDLERQVRRLMGDGYPNLRSMRIEHKSLVFVPEDLENLGWEASEGACTILKKVRTTG
ncbi:hypothetical protein BX600DRAFT_469610 [Xylariales sp. PMI_506]|nr:hypothetical protein BX600DRAFT_469610 [Xylariales sp. PMI_506]